MLGYRRTSGVAACLLAAAVVIAGAVPALAQAPDAGSEPLATPAVVTPQADPGPSDAGTQTSAVPGEVLVTWRDDTSQAARGVLRERYDLDLEAALPLTETEQVSLDPGVTVAEAIADLADDPKVESVQPNYRYGRQGPSTPDPDLWGLRNVGQYIDGAETFSTGNVDIDIQAPEAWGTTSGSSSVRVAVIDTGVQIKHSDIAPNVWTNSGETGTDGGGNNKRTNGVDDDGNGYVDDVHGWDFIHDDASVYDGENCGGFNNDDHGTHVAGTIAGADNGSGIVGVAPGVQVMPLKILGCSDGNTADLILALAYAKANGARIANMSLGGAFFDAALRSAIESSGLLVVAAAGNGDFGGSPQFGLPASCFGGGGDPVATCPMYPAAFPSDNIVSVAAVNNRGALASFSSYGSVGPGGTTATGVDVAAPGQDVLSSVPIGYGASSTNGLAYFSGTSMAAPHVTGVAALVESVQPSFTAAQLRGRILSTVRPLAAVNGRTVTGGLVDAAAAVSGVPSPTSATALAVSVSATTITYGQAVKINGKLTRGGASLPNRTVRLQRFVGGFTQWATVCTTTTDSAGVARCANVPSAKSSYRFSFSADPGLSSSVSASAGVSVRPTMSAKLSPSLVKKSQVTTFSGVLSPRKPGALVVLQRWNGLRWSTVTSGRTYSTSGYAFAFSSKSAGTFSYRVLFPGDSAHASATTAVLRLRVA